MTDSERPNLDPYPPGEEYLLREEELTSTKGDAFDHEAHVETLENLVANVDTPWHIGLYGTWGSGKTTIVDILYNRIRKSQQYDGRYTDDEIAKELEEVNAGDFDDENRLNHVICAKLDAWKHAEGSVRSELLLDLNRSIAEELDKMLPEANVFEDEKNQEEYPIYVRFGGWLRRIPGRFFHWVMGLPIVKWTPIIGERRRDTSEPSRPESLTRRGKGLLDNEAIVHRLYDVEEDVKSTIRGISETLLRLSSGTVTAILVVAAFWLSVEFFEPQITLFGTQLGIDLAANVLVVGVIGTVVLNLASSEIHEARTDVQRTMVNPQRDWSGAYENLFLSILDEAADTYREHVPIDEKEEPTFVITIDDLDRCENKTAYDILIYLKSFLAVENCIYIIPCDRDALLKHLASVDKSEYLAESSNQQNFLAKLIDTELELSNPVQNQIDRYLNRQERRLEHEFKPETKWVLRQADFATPRRVVRILNRLVVLTELATNRSNTTLDEVQSPTRLGVPEFAMDDGGEKLKNQNGDSEEEREGWDWDMAYLAIVAVLQEAHPNFFSHLVDDPYQLYEVYAGIQGRDGNAFGDTLEYRLDETGVPEEERERLVTFLIKTRSVGTRVNDPEPYVRLGGSELTAIDTFEKRLREGRVSALKQLIEQFPTKARITISKKVKDENDDSSDEDETEELGEPSGDKPDNHPTGRSRSDYGFVDVVETQLTEIRPNEQAVIAAIKCLGKFPGEDLRDDKLPERNARDRVARAITVGIERIDGGVDLAGEITSDELGKLTDTVGEGRRVAVVMEAYVTSLIERPGVPRQELRDLSEDYGEQLLTENLQQAFLNSVKQLVENPDISEADVRRLLDGVQEECPELYTTELVKSAWI